MNSMPDKPTAESTSVTDDKIKVTKLSRETDEAALARVAYDPAARAAGVGRRFIAPIMGERKLAASYAALEQQIANIKTGDLSEVERRLISQADTLDAIFNDMARRAALNSGQYLGTMEIYLRLALKAQTQCRATLETLANIKNPPIVIAKQANIAAGPQQINNGSTGPARAHAGENDENDYQSHAPSRPDEPGTPLLCHEQALKMPVPSARGQRVQSLPDARGKGRSPPG